MLNIFLMCSILILISCEGSQGKGSDDAPLALPSSKTAEIEFKRIAVTPSARFQWHEDLEILEKELAGNGIDLKLSTFKDRKSVNRILNKEAIADFMASQASPQKEILQRLFNKLVRLTDEDLEQALIALIQELEKEIGPEAIYSLGFTPGKSSQWVAARAMQLMKKTPTSAWRLPDDIGLGGSEPGLERFSYDRKERVHIFFDDMSLSGTQLETILCDLADNKASEMHHVFVVVAFISPTAEQLLLKKGGFFRLHLQDKKNVAFHILTTERRLPVLKEVVSFDEWKSYCFSGFEGYAPSSCKELYETALFYADWKVPDNRSLYPGLVSIAKLTEPYETYDKNHYLFAPVYHRTYAPGKGWTFIDNVKAPATYK